MWIVKIALDRPYTFIVLASLILILSPVVTQSTPTDILPSIKDLTKPRLNDIALNFLRTQLVTVPEEAEANAADLQTANLSLHTELAVDYFELRTADTQQQLLDETAKAYADALRLTRNRFEGGAAPKSDVAQAQTQLNGARVQGADIGVVRAQCEHAIAILVGKPPAEFNIPRAPEPCSNFRSSPSGRLRLS